MTRMTDDDGCYNCAAFLARDADHGECRRYAPRPTITMRSYGPPDADEERDDVGAVEAAPQDFGNVNWPIVSPVYDSAWCMEWLPKTVSERDASEA